MPTSIKKVAGPCAQSVLDQTSTVQCCSLNSFDMRCPRAHVDVQILVWCRLGAYLVPPRCRLAPLDLVPEPSWVSKNPA